MRRRILTALLLSLAVGLAGCRSPVQEAPEPPAEETPSPVLEPAPAATPFVLPCYAQAGFHPITGENRTNLILSGLLYEGLFAVTPSFEARPVLCTSYTVSEDALTWTFSLDPSARFSDGSPLTPADVVYSLNLARQSGLYGARLAGVAGVSAGEGAVVVALSSPNSGLPLLLDVPVVRESGDPTRPLGTGLYVLEGTGEDLSLRGWRGDAPLARIPLLAVAEAGDLIHAFETRDVSLVTTDFSSANALGFSGSFETQDFPTSVLLYVGFNADQGLCRDEGLRLALQRAFDRSAVSTVLLARHAREAALPAPPESPLYDQALAETLSYNPAETIRLLEELGWTAGGDGTRTRGRQALALDLVVNSGNTVRLAAARQLAADLEAVGIAVNLRSLPWEEYCSALERGDFDLYLGEVRMTADFDLSPFLLKGGALNYGGYDDDEAAALLSALLAAPGADRPRAARALYARLAQCPAFVPLCFKSWSVLTQWGQAEEITPTQQNVFYGFSAWKIRAG